MPGILLAYPELSKKTDDELIKMIEAEIKLRCKPSFTKSTSHGIHAGNPYELCLVITFMWLRMMMLGESASPDQRRNFKDQFFAALTKTNMPPITREPTEEEKAQQKANFFAKLARTGIIPEGTTTSGQFWNSGMFLGRTAGICHTLFYELSSVVGLIVEKMLKQKVSRIGIFISSFDLWHAVGMRIVIHQNYITVVFFDPNAIGGDAKIALSPTDPKNWTARISSLISHVYSRIESPAPHADLTLICLNSNRNEGPLDFGSSSNIFSSEGTYKSDMYAFFAQKFLCAMVCNYCVPELDKVYLDEIKRLTSIVRGNDINLPSEIGMTPLYCASKWGYAFVVEILLKHQEIDVNRPDNDRNTPLCAAAEFGHMAVVELLIKKNANVNAYNKNGVTPLFNACARGYANVVMMLVTQPGIDMNRPRKDGFTPLHAACAIGHTLIARILIDYGAHINRKTHHHFSPLRIALENRHSEIVEILLAKPEIEVSGIEIDYALRSGQTELADRLYAIQVKWYRTTLGHDND